MGNGISSPSRNTFIVVKENVTAHQAEQDVSLDEKQSYIQQYSRESTGTSGYSSNSYDNVPSLNSYKGKKLQIDIKTSMQKGLYSDDQRKILVMFRFLIGEIDAANLTDYFLRDGYFTYRDVEDISSIKPRYKQVIELLLKVLRLIPKAYEDFLKYLNDAGYGHVSRLLEEPIFILALNHEPVSANDALERLKRCKDIFVKDLEPDEVAYIFLEYEEFTIDEFEKIMAENTRMEKALCIYKLLTEPHILPRRYLVLVQALTETNQHFLLLHVQNNNQEHQSLVSPEKNSLSFKVEDIKVKATPGENKRLKESDRCKIILNIHGKDDMKKVELDIITEMKKVGVIAVINDELIFDKECLIADTEPGSIEITLKACGSTSFRNLFSKGVQDPTIYILKKIFLHPNIRRHIPARGLDIKAVVISLPKEEKGRESYSERVLKYMEFLLEELDALTFLKALKDKAALTDDDVSTILTSTPTTRKTRTRAMLEKLLDKDTVETFVEILKEKKKYVWEYVFKPIENDLQDASNAIVESYKTVPDNMTPKSYLFEDWLSTTTFESDWNREKQARFVLQNVFKQDSETKLLLVNILALYDQIPKQIVPKAIKASHQKQYYKKSEDRALYKPKMIFSAELRIFMKEKRRQGFYPQNMMCDHSLNPLAISRSLTGINRRKRVTEEKSG